MDHPPDWIHGLWAAVVALFWRLWASRDNDFKDLKRKVEHMDGVLGGHGAKLVEQRALTSNLEDGMLRLETALKDNSVETRRVADTLARIETLITGRINHG